MRQPHILVVNGGKTMSEVKRQLLTIGVFFIVLVAALLLAVTQIIDWKLFGPVVFMLFGAWMLVLAAIRGAHPQKYERSAFSTISLGAILLVGGGAWGMLVLSINWVYALVLVLAVCAAIAIAAAIRHK